LLAGIHQRRRLFHSLTLSSQEIRLSNEKVLIEGAEPLATENGEKSESFQSRYQVVGDCLDLLKLSAVLGGFQTVDIESTTYQRPPEASPLCFAHRLVLLVTEAQHPLQVMLVNAVRCCRSTHDKISIPPTIAIAPAMLLVRRGLQNFLSPKRTNRSCTVIACEGSMH
jgi:hypothetical protein